MPPCPTGSIAYAKYINSSVNYSYKNNVNHFNQQMFEFHGYYKVVCIYHDKLHHNIITIMDLSNRYSYISYYQYYWHITNLKYTAVGTSPMGLGCLHAFPNALACRGIATT